MQRERLFAELKIGFGIRRAFIGAPSPSPVGFLLQFCYHTGTSASLSVPQVQPHGFCLTFRQMNLGFAYLMEDFCCSPFVLPSTGPRRATLGY